MEYDLYTDGQNVVTGNTTQTGSFRALQAVANTTVSAMEWDADYEASGNWTSLTVIPQGTTLYGRFNSITLGSGQAILYKVV